MQSVHPPNPFLFLPTLPHSNPHHLPLPQDTRTQLFVNNLPFRVRWQDLKDLFRKAGTVLRADVSLTTENRSKGFGTVLFANRMDAYKAVEIYHGFTWQTRVLEVRLDQQDPTGALGMAAATAPPAIPSLQQQKQKQQLHHPSQVHLHPPQQHPFNNGLNHPPPNHHPLPPPHPLLRFPSSTDARPRIGVNHSTNDHLADVNGVSTMGPTRIGTSDLHRSSSTHLQHPLAIQDTLTPTRPASVDAHGSTQSNFSIPSTSLPARRLSSNPELPHSSAQRPVHSYQKHQHSQSLIPFSSNSSDQPFNLAQSAFNSPHVPSNHRSSRSVQLFSHHITPPGSSSTTHSPQPPSNHGLDVHQPEFKPALTSISHSLSHLEISNNSTTSSIPSLVISSVASNPASSALSGSIESLPPSSLGSHTSQVSVTDYHASPAFHYSSVPPSYPHHIMSNNGQRGPYLPPPSLASRVLFVGNLPFSFQWQDLKDLFRQAGNILRADVATTADGRSRGFGTVLFATAEDAAKALEMYEGYELKGRLLKVHFDQFAHPPTCEAGGDSTWNDPAGIFAPNFYPMQHSQQPNHLSIPVPVQQVEGGEDDHPNHVLTPPAHKSNSDQHGAESHDDQRSDLWAPEPVTNGPRPSLPSIIPPPLSPIASRRSSYFKSNNPSEYSMINSEAQHNKSANGPEPIGHPSTLARPQAIPLPPPYDLKGVSAGMMSPAIPKVIQMTPSMPAFSFQAFMPATPPLLPQFFSPGIGPPCTPPYGRGGGTPPPALKSINSPLGASSMFPVEAERSEVEDTNLAQSIIRNDSQGETEQIADDEIQPRTLDSNVDWGYQSSSIPSNRRASLFIGRAGHGHLFHNHTNQEHGRVPSAESSTNSTATQMKMNNRNGFPGRRLLGVGEDLAEDGFNENYTRRASFDVRSLLSNNNHQRSKLNKTRPKNILISSGCVEDKEEEKLETNNNDIFNNQMGKNQVQDTTVGNNDTNNSNHNFLVNNHQSDRLDLVGLGFVESIWAKKE